MVVRADKAEMVDMMIPTTKFMDTVVVVVHGKNDAKGVKHAEEFGAVAALRTLKDSCPGAAFPVLCVGAGTNIEAFSKNPWWLPIFH